ncbi:hypothetical protein HDU98_007601 [Podochytrium sp. JEL0797]|nr:hypothetical protein HDU98_007601 [Podochytrium sp. JEL0797]
MDPDAEAPVEISLSVADTNRLRISLGLKPLDASTGGSKGDQAAAANFLAEKKRLQKRQERKDIMARLGREENKDKFFTRLEGKGLGDASDEEEEGGDSLKWALSHKKTVRRNLKGVAAEAMREEEQEAVQYDAEDLKGLRVGHSLEDISDDILVLKDRKIGDGEDESDDELVSSKITAKERLEMNLKNKKNKPNYSAYDDDEFNNPGQKRSLLSHYDEDNETSGFVLGVGGRVEAQEEDEASKILGGAKTVSLEYEKMQVVKDYYTQEEAVAFMKPKKKKKKGKSRTRDEPDWPTANQEEGPGGDSGAMDVDGSAPSGGAGGSRAGGAATFSRSNRDSNVDLNVNFVDDDDLQMALSRARNLANKKIKRPNVEEMLKAAEEIEQQQQTATAGGSDDSDDEGLTLSATSEFVNNLATAPVARATTSRPAVASRLRVRDEDSDEDDEEDKPVPENVEKESEDAADPWGDVNMQESADAAEDEDGEDAEEKEGGIMGGIEEEPLISGGLAATLRLLSKQGFLEKVDSDQLEREKKQKERAQWLAEQRIHDRKREIIKEREKAMQREINKAKGPAKRGGGGGGNAMSAEDEWKLEEENQRMERQRTRDIEERFKTYTPDVIIKYNDEYGRDLTPKEAFRLQSHKFHGMGSGKMKTEKRLLKMDEEAQLNKMLSADTPLHTASALLEKTKKAKTAHLVLAVGNRGSLPQDVVAAEEKALLEKRNARLAAAAKAKADKASKAKQSGTSSVASTKGTSSVAPRGKITFGLAGGGGGAKRKADSAAGFEESLAKKSK